MTEFLIYGGIAGLGLVAVVLVALVAMEALTRRCRIRDRVERSFPFT